MTNPELRQGRPRPPVGPARSRPAAAAPPGHPTSRQFNPRTDRSGREIIRGVSSNHGTTDPAGAGSGDAPAQGIIDQLEPFVWSDQESVAYEAALEAINELVGAYTALIARERATETPDLDAITRWTQQRAACAGARRALDPTDHAEVARVRIDYPARTAAVRLT